jgi:hypothetical protein
MKKILKSLSYCIVLFASISILNSCQEEELSPAEQLLGAWRCNMSDGDWDEYNFISTTNVSYRYFDAYDGEISTTNYSFEATASKILLTATDGTIYAVTYSLNKDELIIDNYIYFRQN